jgi:ferredoxin-NADP reductase
LSRTTTLPMRVTAMRWEAEGVIRVTLKPLDGGQPPAFTAGSHIDLHLPNQTIRQYSLLTDPANRSQYDVAVALDEKTRGGSRYVHEALRVGAVIDVGGPRNAFPVAEGADEVVMLAGGIGVTPFVSMMHRLNALGRRYTLYYATRSRARAGLLEELGVVGGDRVQLHFDDEQGRVFDIAEVIARHPSAHFYCCGPAPMIAAFEQAAAGLAPGTVHVERFAPAAAEPAAGQSFVVELARSGREIDVPESVSLLQALRGAGVNVPSSCEDGICGTCEVRVLEGVPDHRDSILTAAERAANTSMMCCVSRAKTSKLVLDL